jgi:hypothetical protein
MGQVDAGVDDRDIDAGALVRLALRVDPAHARPERLLLDRHLAVRHQELDLGVGPEDCDSSRATLAA